MVMFMTYSDRIRALREDRDLPQKAVAAMLHVSQCTYSGYESGKIHISVENLLFLARFYDVDMNYICGISDVRWPYPTE